VTKVVMVVEDDPATRRLYRFLLANSGYSVIEAEDGMAALSQLATAPCDVIITDMNMPRMSGLDLVRTLRQQGSGVYVIMITAFGTPESERHAFRSGVNDYLTKPFEFEDLEQRVQNFFTQRWGD
jgi:two-component system chemotaxis response regulator CheY